MSRLQKKAWFTLAVVSLALGLSLAAFGVGFFLFDLPAKRAVGGFGFFGIMGLLGLTPLLFGRHKEKVQWDERDQMIHRNAVVAGYATFWVVFVAAAMIPWFLTGPDGTITVNYLPWMVFGGMIIVELVQAVATLAQYGWTEKEACHE